jgi:L-aspartate oxidase
LNYAHGSTIKARTAFGVNAAKTGMGQDSMTPGQTGTSIAHGETIHTDHLVIGTGIAGLMLALKLARHGRVLVIAKGSLEDNNTWMAQGGIASVLDNADSFENHVRDTIAAGAGLCHPPVVRMVVENGPRLIRELIDIGVRFTRTGDEPGSNYHLTREGGHSHRRVIHADDLTGKEVLSALIRAAKEQPSIRILEHQMAVDLVTSNKFGPQDRRAGFAAPECFGAYVMDRATRAVYLVQSPRTYLCTGGHGKAYLYTSNPDSATGDGLAMAWRAGCRIANLEFMQFHPTCLFHPRAKTFLISEAVRGEGGVLRDQQGRSFMEAWHPMGSLAPRDVVSRAIDAELKKSGASNVFLDIRHLGEEKLRRLFPNIYQTCLQFGIDMARDMIPVVPAAHYSCGGVAVDDSGRTGISGLYALGEVACSGLHGANRLASNSLLEALVYADRVASDVTSDLCGDISSGAASVAKVEAQEHAIPAWDKGSAVPPDELVVLSHNWDEIRRLMWHYVGIVRSEKRLKRALSRIAAIRAELDEYYWNYELTEQLLEVRNLALVAWLTVRCAMARKESRGIHFTIDHPRPDERLAGRDTIMVSAT